LLRAVDAISVRVGGILPRDGHHRPPSFLLTPKKAQSATTRSNNE
jgi:hypothetical protein